LQGLRCFSFFSERWLSFVVLNRLYHSRPGVL
jgi:hypothetical protein